MSEGLDILYWGRTSESSHDIWPILDSMSVHIQKAYVDIWHHWPKSAFLVILPKKALQHLTDKDHTVLGEGVGG